MKKDKDKDAPIKAKTVGELIHHFVHATFEEESRSNYSYEKDMLFYGSICIAKVFRTTNVVVINDTFNRSGSYGNGYSSRNVKHAFDDSWKVLNYDKVLSLSDTLTKDDYLKLILYTIKDNIITHVGRFVREKELITNDHAFNVGYTYEIKIEAISTLCDNFNVDINLVYNHVYNDTTSVYIRSHGWSRYATENYKIDKPIIFYLTPDLWHTKEEQYILDFKKWKTKYINIITPSTTYKKVYDNLNLRLEHEARCIAKLKHIEEEKIRDEEIAKQKRLIAAEKDIANWLTGNTVHTSLWGLPIHLRLKGDQVETTLGVFVPLTHAKLLYKKYLECKRTGTNWISNGHSIAIGNYKVEYIKLLDDHWYIKAGCHTIKDDQIESFVNTNDLQDWRG